MKSISVVVVKPIMGETLVDWQTHVVKTVHFDDDLALVVVEGVVSCVANNLAKFK